MSMTTRTPYVTGSHRSGALSSTCYRFDRSRDLKAIARRYGWVTSMCQLEPGSLQVTGVVATGATATVLDLSLSHSLEIRGRTKLNTVAVILPEGGTQLWLNGYGLTSNTAIALPPGAAIAAWSSGAARALIVLVPAGLLQLGRLFSAEDERALRAGEALQSRAAKASELQTRIRALHCTPHRGCAYVDCDGRIAWHSVPNTARDCKSFPVISRAVEYIDAELGGSISSADLTVAAASSLSKLERTFRREIGLTPSAYVRVRRLHAARAEFRSGCVRQVAAVAFDNGFRHLGRFSGAYRRFFGELPSETLQMSE